MATQKEKETLLKEFNNYKNKDFSRAGSDYEFHKADARLRKIASILDQIKNITHEELEGRDDVESNIFKAIKEFNEICSKIKSFDATKGDPNRLANQVESESRALYNNIFLNQSSSNYSTFPALASYNSLEKVDATKIKGIISEIEDFRNEASELVENIKDSSREKFAHDYSVIFHKEALAHSRFKLTKVDDSAKNQKRWLGISEKYLIAGIGLIVLLLWMIFDNFFIPGLEDIRNSLSNVKAVGLDNVTYTEVLIPFYIKKVLLLGLILFCIRFCLKQFSINKHLSIVNKQRANALDSFEFFYKNLGEGESKEQYLIEVAKSIFSTKETGFIKTDTNDSISFTEHFKFFKNPE